jgi:hypothetical protein
VSLDARAARFATRPADCDVPEAPDIEALIAKHCGTSYVTETGQLVTPDRELPDKTTPEFALEDPLLVALGVEHEHDTSDDVLSPDHRDPRWGPSPVKLEDARDLGREPLPPGPGLLRRSTAEILELVAQHAPAGARELAKTLAARARELEVTR